MSSIESDFNEFDESIKVFSSVSSFDSFIAIAINSL